MASASNVGPILQRIKAVEVDGNHRDARVVGGAVLARNVEVVMEKIGGRVNRLCGCVHPTVAKGVDDDRLATFLAFDGLSFYL